MKNKKIISFILAFTIILTLLPIGVFAAEGSATLSQISGNGTENEPFLIKTADDMKTLSEAVANGQSFKDTYFKLESDITLPTDWTPIGTSIKKYPFSGNFDGDGHLITIQKGEKAPFGVTVEAYLHDFDVYGEEINGTAVVDTYTTGAAGKTSVTIENVNLKSGTKTLKSGYIGGYSHGNSPVYINNCTVEKGVTIGYDKSQKWIGSFGGEFNGSIKNCVSYAEVYGTDFVGGIVADKGQSMGLFEIENCKFYGTAEATGNYAGGICGAGYGGTTFGMASAPNSPCVTIKNCVSYGKVKGFNYVGGILGGEGAVYQCWDNGIGEIKNNYFCGTVSSDNQNAYVGAIIGYIAGLDKYNEIENNRYTDDCGASTGIAFVAYVDTDCITHETNSATTYINTGDESVPLPDFKAGNGRWDPKCFTKRNHNRSDDPIGADADKLCLMVKSDLSAAQEVINAIDNLGEITLNSKTQIDAVFAMFNALTDEQKSLVTNKSVLDAALKEYEKLAAQSGDNNTEDKNVASDGKTLQKTANTAIGDAYSPKTADGFEYSSCILIMIFCAISVFGVSFNLKFRKEK